MPNIPDDFEYSLTCFGCGTKYVARAKTPGEHCDNARKAGWEVPDIIENRPIRCPTCKPKITLVKPI